MLDLRKRVFIAVSMIVGLIIALLLLYLFVFNRETTKEVDVIVEVDTDIIQTQSNLSGINTYTRPITPNTEVVEVTSIIPIDSDEVYTKQLSRIFVERFSTYSNQNNNSHIDGVLPLVTNKMATWLKTQNLQQSFDYEGITTKVMASSVENIDKNSARVIVETQQVLETFDTVEKVQKSGHVDLVKINNDWKVDGFFWD